MEEVERAARLECFFNVAERHAQKRVELRAFHRVILDGLAVQTVVVHVAWRIGEPEAALTIAEITAFLAANSHTADWAPRTRRIGSSISRQDAIIKVEITIVSRPPMS